jgi:hypothetical protein
MSVPFVTNVTACRRYDRVPNGGARSPVTISPSPANAELKKHPWKQPHYDSKTAYQLIWQSTAQDTCKNK